MPIQTPKIPLDGAVDLDGKEHTIDDGSLRKMQNCIPDKMRNPVRRGTMNFEASLAATGTQVPYWMGLPSNHPDVVVAAVTDGLSTSLYAAQISGNYATAAIKDTAPDILPSLFTSRGEDYVVQGPSSRHTAGMYIAPDPYNTPDFKWADFYFVDAGNDALAPRLASVWKNRVYYFIDEILLVSDIDDPLTIGANALTDRSLPVGTITGDRVSAAHPVMLSAMGSPAESALLITKRNSCYLLTGDLPESDDVEWPASDAKLIKISSPAGCVSHGSMADTPWGTIWCGVDDVWFMPFGAIPIPIGRRIKPLLKAQPEAHAWRIHAAYHNGFYRLSLFAENQGPDGTATLQEQWWLDLRDGIPEDWNKARWFGPMVFKPTVTNTGDRGSDNTLQGTYYMMPDPRIGLNNKLLGIHYAMVPGGLAGGDSGLTLVSYDNPGPRDICMLFRGGLVPWHSHGIYLVGDEIVVNDTTFNNNNNQASLVIYKVSSISDPDGVAGSSEPAWTAAGYTDGHVEWARYMRVLSPAQMYGSEALVAIHTKQYDFGSRMVEKGFQGIELNYFLTTPERFTVTQLVDGGKTLDVLSKNLERTSGPLIGADLLNFIDELIAEEYKSTAFYSADGTRIIGKTLQLKIEEVAGIVIPDAFLTFYVIIGGVGLGTEIPCTLTSSYHQSLSALVLGIINAVATGKVAAVASGLLPSNDQGVLALDPKHTFLTITSTIPDSVNTNWAPSIADRATRYIWSLLGYSAAEGLFADTDAQTGDEIPYDVNIGDLGLAEATMKINVFKRRPGS